MSQLNNERDEKDNMQNVNNGKKPENFNVQNVNNAQKSEKDNTQNACNDEKFEKFNAQKVNNTEKSEKNNVQNQSNDKNYEKYNKKDVIKGEDSKKKNKTKNQTETKQHSTRNMILFLGVFTIVCVATTMYLIYSNRSKIHQQQAKVPGNEAVSGTVNDAKNEKVENNIRQVNATVLGLNSLQETYKGNNLKVESTEFTDGKKTTDAYGVSYQVQGNYIQIKGLKNKEIENSINTILKDEALNCYTESDLNKYGEIYIESKCVGNFANVLSVSISVYLNEYNDKFSNFYKGLNFDLSTGNELSFEDIFTSDATVKNILSKSAYDSYAANIVGGYIRQDKFYSAEDYEADDEFEQNNYTAEEIKAIREEEKNRQNEYAEIENDVFRLMAYYSNGGKLDFCFSPRTVKVFYNSKVATIPMISYYNQIAIYNRFKNNSDIYDGSYKDYIANDSIPVMTATNNFGVSPDVEAHNEAIMLDYFNLRQVSDSLILYIDAQSAYRESDKDIFSRSSATLDKVNEIIEEEKNKNKDKARYVSISVAEDTDDDGKASGEYSISVIEKYSDIKYKKIFLENIMSQFQHGEYSVYSINTESGLYSNYTENELEDAYNNLLENHFELKYDGKSKDWKKTDFMVDGVDVYNYGTVDDDKKEEIGENEDGNAVNSSDSNNLEDENVKSDNGNNKDIDSDTEKNGENSPNNVDNSTKTNSTDDIAGNNSNKNDTDNKQSNIENNGSKNNIENNQNNIDNNVNQNNGNNNASKKIIVIDPGHQTKGNNEKEPIGPGATKTKAKVTGGATGVSTGQTEYALNLKVALKLQQALIAKGYTVIMTRTTNDVNISNKERAEVANNANAAAFVRIHANSSTSSSANGTLTMCQTANNPYNGNMAGESYRLSKLILDNVIKRTGSNNRGVTRTDDMSGINWCTVPSTILEMGFLSNSEEDKLLANEAYQDKIVEGIVAGLEEFLK